VEKPNSPKKSQEAKFFAYLKVFIVPTLILKMAILYFGLKYSQYPDEGYGWWLLAAVLLSLVNFGIFLYQNWDETEDETS
jgi:putative effector of murein hydrolase